MKAIVLLVLYVAASEAQIMAFGGCPNLPSVNDFNLTSIYGKWYEAERYYSFLQIFSKCSTTTFSPNDVQSFKIASFQIDSILQIPSTIEMTARFNANSTSSKFSVNFPFLLLQIPVSYEILDTDYNTYLLAYSCTDMIGYNTRLVWVLTRQRFPSDAILQRAHAALAERNLDSNLLVKTQQFDCPVTH